MTESEKQEVLDFMSSVQARMILVPGHHHHRDASINSIMYDELEKRGIKPVYDNRKDIEDAS